MKERFTSFWGTVRDMWNRATRKMRIIVLSVAAVILALSLAAVLWLNHTEYVVLYDNLSTAENAEVFAQLQEMGVEGRLEGTRLLIPVSAENTVRMQLAAKGYRDSGFDYSTFEKGGSLTATQADKAQYAIYQMQERLQATIETFSEISQAIVTISIPEKEAFALERETVVPTASVKLQLHPGRELTTEQVQGILNIVKNSVPNLAEENISISDQSGDLLGSIAMGKDALATKVMLTEQMNELIKRRVMSMLGPLYGADRVNVAVNNVLDTDKKVVEETEYIPLDPENPTNNPVDYWERARERTGVGGVAEGVPGANDNVDVPEYLAEETDIEADYYSTHDVVDYLISSKKSQIVKEGLDIIDTTVAVLIDAETLSSDEIRSITELVAATIGVDSEAAFDKVTVKNFKFNSLTATDSFGPDPQLRRVIIASAIALCALILIFLLVLLLLRRRQKQQALAAEGAYLEDGATLVDLMGQEEDFEPIAIPETNEQKLKNQIRDLALSDPEIVAQLIKTWLMN